MLRSPVIDAPYAIMHAKLEMYAAERARMVASGVVPVDVVPVVAIVGPTCICNTTDTPMRDAVRLVAEYCALAPRKRAARLQDLLLSAEAERLESLNL